MTDRTAVEWGERGQAGERRLVEDSRIVVRDEGETRSIAVDGVLLEVHGVPEAKIDKHARHFAEVMQQPGWTRGNGRETPE